MALSYCPSTSTTAPINISNNTKTCQTTCSLIPKYSQTSITSTNYGTYLNVVPNLTQSDTLFNGQTYIVQEIRIYSGALHSYFDVDGKAEMLLIHTNANLAGNEPLLIISIPIVVSSTPNLASFDLETIIKETSAWACSTTTTNSIGCIAQSSPLTINTIDFNLNNFIPKGAYYFYKGIFSFQNQDSLSNCATSSNIIVYSPSSGGISIGQETFKILESLVVKPTADHFKKYSNPTIYYNTGGVGKNAEEEIYIECQPVNTSTEKVAVPLVPINSAAQNINKLFQEIENIGESPITNSLFGVMLMLGIYFLTKVIIDKMGSIHK